MKKLLAKIMSNSYINLTFEGGNSLIFNKDHGNFEKVKSLILTTRSKPISYEELEPLHNQLIGAKKYVANTGLEFKDNKLYFNNTELHNAVVDHIIELKNEGYNVQYLMNFLKNLLENPLESARNELYEFLEVGKLPITDDGHFLAYKRVRENFKDIHSGKFDNSVGKVVEEERSKLDTNRNNLCSTGLHFCSLEYLPNFSSTNPKTDKVVVVKINPKDVIAIPTDHNLTKGRTCRYEVIGIHEYEKHENHPIMKEKVVKIKKTMSKRTPDGKFTKIYTPARDASGKFISKKSTKVNNRDSKGRFTKRKKK